VNILLTLHHFMDRNAGAAGVTYRLAEEFRRLGHQAEIFSFDQLPRRLPYNAANLLFPKYLSSYCKKLQKTAKVDVIDASSGDAWLYTALRSQNDGAAVVTRSHGLEHVAHDMRVQMKKKGEMKLSWKYPIYHGGYRLWEVARSFRAADGAIFLNQNDRDYALDKFGLRSSEIIGNGIPDYLLGLPAPAPVGEEEPLRIAMIGSYIPRKGVQYAAEALKDILAAHKQLEVTLLGTQCDSGRVYEDYAPALHGRIKVVPRFKHEELPELLQGHHILLFPSLSEGFGLALVEAMACGLAPVATAIPGPKDIVTDGYDAVTIPPGNPAAIAEALELLLRDRNILNKLRMNAHGTAQHYSWRSVAEQTLAFYAKCIGQKDGTDRLQAIR
jgi:glycosyltransferase involved in cell wall biosynthesis